MACDQVCLREEILERHVFKKDWSVCSKCNNHLRFSNQLDFFLGGGEYMTILRTREIFTLIIHKILI